MIIIIVFTGIIIITNIIIIAISVICIIYGAGTVGY